MFSFANGPAMPTITPRPGAKTTPNLYPFHRRLPGVSEHQWPHVRPAEPQREETQPARTRAAGGLNPARRWRPRPALRGMGSFGWRRQACGRPSAVIAGAFYVVVFGNR